MTTPADKNIDVEIYKALANPKKLEFAIEKKPKVKEEDYELGYITRYFLRQVNYSLAYVLEIDKAQFNKFKTEPFYINLEINWKITGSAEQIINTNLNIIVEANKKMNGIRELLENELLEFAKLS